MLLHLQLCTNLPPDGTRVPLLTSPAVFETFIFKTMPIFLSLLQLHTRVFLPCHFNFLLPYMLMTTSIRYIYWYFSLINVVHKMCDADACSTHMHRQMALQGCSLL